MKRFLSIGLLLASVSFSFAQSPVITSPQGSNIVTGSSSITVTNTFQSIFAASGSNTGRMGCTVQNNGTHTMFVFFGPIANATTSNSVQLSAGNNVKCNSGVIVLKDQVSITGTSGDAFFAAQQ